MKKRMMATRRGEPELLADEADLVHVLHHRLGGVARTPLGQDVDLGEELEGLDRGDDQHEDVGLPEPRPGHEAEALPGRGAVEACGLVEIARDALQPREIDHHLEAVGLPGREQHDRRHRRARVAEPVDRPAEAEGQEADDLVERAGRELEQRSPDHADDRHRGDRRQEQRAAEEVAAGELLVDEQRHGEGEAALDRHHQQREVADVEQRPPEDRVGQHVDVIVEPDETHRPRDQPPVGHRHRERQDERQEQEEGHDRTGRQQHQELLPPGADQPFRARRLGRAGHRQSRRSHVCPFLEHGWVGRGEAEASPRGGAVSCRRRADIRRCPRCPRRCPPRPWSAPPSGRRRRGCW